MCIEPPNVLIRSCLEAENEKWKSFISHQKFSHSAALKHDDGQPSKVLSENGLGHKCPVSYSNLQDQGRSTLPTLYNKKNISVFLDVYLIH